MWSHQSCYKFAISQFVYLWCQTPNKPKMKYVEITHVLPNKPKGFHVPLISSIISKIVILQASWHDNIIRWQNLPKENIFIFNYYNLLLFLGRVLMLHTCNERGHIILISYFATILTIMELPKNSQIHLLFL